MSIIRVTIRKGIQDSQEYGSTEIRRAYRAFFTIRTDNDPPVEDYCHITEIIGSSHSSGHIEVSPPNSYRGPYDHQLFSNEIAAYYAKLVRNSEKTRIANNTFEMAHEFAFKTEAQDTLGSGMS